MPDFFPGFKQRQIETSGAAEPRCISMKEHLVERRSTAALKGAS